MRHRKPGKSVVYKLLHKTKKIFSRNFKPLRDMVCCAMLICLLLLLSVAGPAPAQAANPEPNPELSQACGLDIALVIDSSGSIDTAELSEMKNAFKSFVADLLPGTPSMFSVTDFDNTASVLQTFTSDVSLINNAIDIPASGGSTNWQDGLSKAFGTFDPRSEPGHPNLIVFASDGEPNKYGNNYGSGADFSQYAFDQAVEQANIIKSGGIRIITLGISLSAEGADHLKAISGVDAYYDVEDFAALSGTLRALAADLCGGTVTVTKLIDADGDMLTTADRLPGAGWEFKISGNLDTTGQDGKSAAWKVDSGTHDVEEIGSQDYFLAEAYCSGAANNWVASGTKITGLEISDSDIVSCVFINSPKPAETLSYRLNVYKDGTGSGSVVSDAGNVACGGVCEDSYGAGALVVLTATPDDGSVFAGWSGAGCSGTGACHITMDADASVTATFNVSTNGGGGEVDIADPAVVKILDNASPAPGAEIIYTITVNNAGTATATAVTIADPLPASVVFISSDGAQSVFDATTTTVTWLIDELEPGGTAVLHITAKVKNDASGEVINTATISTTGGNSRTDNDVSSVKATINQPAQNGGGGSVYTAGNSSGGSGIPVLSSVPQVAGASTSVPGLGLLMPEVLGEATELPRTGLPLGQIFFATAGLVVLLSRKFRYL